MKKIPKKKLKILMAVFLGTGIWGIFLGMILPLTSSFPMYITILGVTQLGLGGFFGWRYLTQEPDINNDDNKRRRRKRYR
ncbi:MAG: hypothetical protein F4Y82_06560 [Cenarchaeum sp. SB0665_bin_23]|nr:hypothetical protein [Cenarchaeum sp. SB0667_bin_13]MXY61752.1 hypothetical protein [Cenarchaeum sp. SB0665_bin_23]MXZ93936.1 hypothetical protein [Cenarchaeum sp. SB0666_bin_15]MYB46138.1 hypothetical protein [Cenarchaeum sp. SB0662_bin_33]MYC79896.1 hypothetical protein [Cenarchaeum sp. SB0661_bin_35]MYD58494.1 hypothetical protein [Cenarchaeum sp. SB0678_bin_8]MYG33313.1 hypothetical protein [Cenarchaeum sp. SB0677_bin_16]MYI51895.1 hypothetical protein [Cenarchaeum sp. SB0673_bin_9]M